MKPLLSTLVLLVLTTGPLAAQAPNVLLILCDDLNTALGCYGAPLVQTPHIDALAARGTKFTRAFCQFPLCNPSRTSLLSGRRPDTTGIVTNDDHPRSFLPHVTFMPDHFKAQGYWIAALGKVFHGDFNDTCAWDLYENPDNPALPNPQGVARVLPFLTTYPDAQLPDGMIARRAAQLMGEAHGGKPFFIVAGMHNPHSPRIARQEHFDLYPPATLPLPTAPPGDRADWPPDLVPRTQPNYEDIATATDEQRAIQAYYGCLTLLDAQIGVLTDRLTELDLWENTIVIFLSDHGYHLGEHPDTVPGQPGRLWAKGSLFVETSRIPLLLAAPGKAPGVCARPVESVSLYATLAELCGLPVPVGVEGVSLVPLLNDPARPWSGAAFTYSKGGRCLADETRRYSEYGPGIPADCDLYDHTADPREFINLAPPPASAAQVAQFSDWLRRDWRAVLPAGLSAPTGLAHWRARFFSTTDSTGVAADLADPDADGLANLLEHLLGTHPGEATVSATAPTLPSTNIAITYSTLNEALADVTPTVQWSNDLVNWFGTGVIHNVLSNDGLVTKTRSRTNLNGAQAKFLRLRAQRTPP